jgi:hypothetical protein
MLAVEKERKPMTSNPWPLIGVSDFVRRQTPESAHNHFAGSWEELAALVHHHWPQRRSSPHNPGVALVPMPVKWLDRFYTSLVKITPETPLKATFAPRAEGEAAFVQIAAPGYSKQPAKRVELVVYSHETLAQDGDAPEPRQADHYLVSINAYASEADEPMHPMTLARNFLGLKGGTQPLVPYSAEEFAQAIVYWSQHTRIDRP